MQDSALHFPLTSDIWKAHVIKHWKESLLHGCKGTKRSFRSFCLTSIPIPRHVYPKTSHLDAMTTLAKVILPQVPNHEVGSEQTGKSDFPSCCSDWLSFLLKPFCRSIQAPGAQIRRGNVDKILFKTSHCNA